MTFFINLMGLSTGMACALMICLWLMDEWSFDRYHRYDGRLFQVMENKTTETGIETKGHTPHFLAEVLAAEMPEVEYAVTVTPPHFFPDFTVSANGKHVKGTGKYVDKDFLKMFSYDLLQGSASSAFPDKNAILLSETMARRLFGDISNIIGTDLEYQIFSLTKSVTIAGVFKDVPENSWEHFDFLLSFDAFRDIMGLQDASLNWDASAPFFTYVLLNEGTDAAAFNDKLLNFLSERSDNARHRSLFLKRYSENYLYGKYENGVATGRIEYVKVFTIIAVAILLLSCINFMNLSTAKASRRAERDRDQKSNRRAAEDTGRPISRRSTPDVVYVPHGCGVACRFAAPAIQFDRGKEPCFKI